MAIDLQEILKKIKPYVLGWIGSTAPRREVAQDDDGAILQDDDGNVIYVEVEE